MRLSSSDTSNLHARLKLFYKYYLRRNDANGPIQAEPGLSVTDLGLNLNKLYLEVKKFKRIFDIRKISDISYKNRSFPVYEINIRLGKRKMLVLSGVHGNEQGGILYLPRLLNNICVDKKSYKGSFIKIVFPVNPVGCEFNSRFNGQGKDINRDFYEFETKEARVVDGVIRKFKPDIVVSHHESPQDGTFLFVTRSVTKDFISAILKEFKLNNVKLARKDYFGLKLRKPGLARLGLFHSLLFKTWKNLFRKSPLGLYCTENKVDLVTVEGSWFDEDLLTRTTSHLSVVKSIANTHGS